MQTLSLRRALRTLFRTPFVTVVAIASLALGIGANAAIFSLFEQFLLRPLPVAAPDELVNLAAPGPKPGSTSCNNAGGCDLVFSYAMFRDLEREQTPFVGIAAHRIFSVNLAYGDETIAGDGALVSGSYFPLLGLQPAAGRLLGPADDQTVGETAVAVLGHQYWQQRLDSDPAVLDDTIVVNGQALTVVGVAPEGFDGTTLGSVPDLYVPITMRARLGQRDDFEERQSYWAYLFARLKPGVSLREAETAINVPYSAILDDVEAPLQDGMSDQTMARFLAKEIPLSEGRRGQADFHEEATAPLILLLAITGLVLVIACSNIANLLLARAAQREGEMAVRLSLGAGRGPLIGQLLFEACILSALGGATGLLVAHWTLAVIIGLLPAEALAMFPTGLSPIALIFTAALSIGTGLVFGLFPALHTTRPDLVSVLKRQSGQPSGSRTAARFRSSLATVQIGMSMVLLVSAGLFTKSLYNVSRVELGIMPDNLVTFGISPSRNGYETEQSAALYDRLHEELSALPGVSAVTAARVPLVAGNNWGQTVSVEGFDAGPDTDVSSRFNAVGPGYFDAVGMPLMAGREFTASDVADAPKVAVVNQQFARKFGLDDGAVGRWMSTGSGDVDLDIQIVGLARDATYSSVKAEVPPLFFLPYRQNGNNIGTMSFYVRGAGAPEQLLTAIPQVVARLDPNLPVTNLRTMEAQIQENVFADRIISVLSAAFAVLATLLGADGYRVRSLVLSQVARMTLIGGSIGLVGAIGLSRLGQALLFELESTDPVVLVASVITLALVALGAGALPAWRASRVEPMRALRYE